jgi:MerR family Zn(II)-responsive transcriptional regulator of zntA
MMRTGARMQIGALAKRVGINPKTIRYYEQVRLLPPARRTPSGYRDYTDEDAARLEFIRSAKALGVTLDEIKEVLAFRDRGTAPCPYVLQLIDAKVEEIAQRIRGLRLLAADLKRLRQAGAKLPREQVAGKARFCHIIENQKLLRSRGAVAKDRGPS